MKPSLVFLVAAFTAAAFGKDAPIPAAHIALHGDHAVLIDGSQSADGRYAVGWSVHAKKGQPPVKWSEYGKEGSTFREDYCDNDGYVVTNVIVDLTRRAIVATFPFSDPYFGGKNHGALGSVIGPERDGHRFVIALSDSKWNPNDVALVDLSADGATSVDLLKVLDAGVGKYIASQSAGKKHLNPEEYSTDYQIYQLPEVGVLTGFADASTVRLPFSSEIPKAEGARIFQGTVQLRLSRDKGGPHAEVVEVRELKSDPDPLEDNPIVAAADKELNAAYAAARGLRNAEGKAKLLEEQRAWIKERDDRIEALRTKIFETPVITNPRFETDRLLLQLTQERTAVLRGK